MKLRRPFLVLLLAVLPRVAMANETNRRGQTRPLEPISATHFADAIRPVLNKFCSDCHDPADSESDVPFLRAKSLTDVATDRAMWKSVTEQLRNRTMPPVDEPQPSEDERLAIARWVDQTLLATACAAGEFAGTILPRRLNRIEYDRTMFDLVGINPKAEEYFPVDGSGGEGFDNNGETLFLPPILMERYLETAGRVLDQVVISPPLRRKVEAAQLLPRGGEIVGGRRIVPSKKETATLVTVYVAGNFAIRIDARTAAPKPAALTLKVDGIAAERFKVKPAETAAGPAPLETVVRLARGVHRIAMRSSSDAGLQVARLEIAEVRKPSSSQAIARHQRLLGQPPGRIPSEPRDAAGEIVARLARRAFRRPLRDGEVEPFLRLYDRASQRGDPYEESVKLALKGVLVSPHFLFRVERPATSDQAEPVDDHELAVRLSYFLWSTMPDDRLSRLADEGRLRDTQVLRQQVDRMLADPRALAFAQSFAGQWLGTREVGARKTPDTGKFKGQFTTELLLDFRDEPVLLFQHIVSEDRSLLELLGADYAILNQRLARHYGLIDGEEKISGNGWSWPPDRAKGGRFQKMDLPDDRRGGVLGMGGVHLLTSHPNRTSPVLRGAWVLETLLGVHVPSPPPNVPPLKRGNNTKASLRRQLAKHREHAACAACHNLMDPPGFALENFDVLGRWREQDGSAVIDASGALPSGETFDGPAGLRQVLLTRKDEFLRHLTQKMLGYALGRSLNERDDCTIIRITDKVKKSGFRARTLVRQIVLSPPFRMKQQVIDTAPANSKG